MAPLSLSNNFYLVIGQESGFAGVDAGRAAAAGRLVDDEPVGVGEREGAAVSAHSDDELLARSAETDPQVGGVVDGQLFAPLRVGRRGEERSVVTHRVLPLAVEIVGHHVDKVQVAGHGRHVVAAVDVVRPDGHSRRQQQTRPFRFLRFRFEGFAQFYPNIKCCCFCRPKLKKWEKKYLSKVRQSCACRPILWGTPNRDPARRIRAVARREWRWKRRSGERSGWPTSPWIWPSRKSIRLHTIRRLGNFYIRKK